MKIDDEVYVHGYIDEICKDIVIIRNDGGYFGTDVREVILADCKNEPSFKVDEVGDNDPTIHAIAYLQKVGWLQEHDRALTEPQKKCITCEHRYAGHIEACDACDPYTKIQPQIEYDKGLKLFADILFDKKKSEQFLKECEVMGIEPQTDGYISGEDFMKIFDETKTERGK